MLNRQGRPRDYIQQEENLNVLKGKWLIGQQVKHNLIRLERMYCRFDEFTEDILLHRMIKYTLRVLFATASSIKSKQILAQQLMKHDGIRDQKFTATDVKELHLNRHTKKYQAILNWCHLFLSGDSPNVIAGSRQCLSFVFDMNKLFEAWVVAELKPWANQHDFRLVPHGYHKKKYLLRHRAQQRQTFQVQPDIIVLNQDDNVVAIWDVKWKIVQKEDEINLNRDDLYQMLSYGHVYGINDLALIYPKTKIAQNIVEYFIQGQRELMLKLLWIDLEQGIKSDWKISTIDS